MTTNVLWLWLRVYISSFRHEDGDKTRQIKRKYVNRQDAKEQEQDCKV